MKTLICTLAAVGISALASFGMAAERTGDFALIDHTGHFHHMDWYNDHRAVVILTQANGSADFVKALPDFLQLRQTYTDQDVQFFLLNPGLQSDRDAVAAELAGLDVDIPVLMDDTQLTSESLKFSRIGQAVIYNPRSFEVLYRGAAGTDLETALRQVLAGEAVTSPEVVASGEIIPFPVRERHQQRVPSYEHEIAPLIAENCASCHRAGGIGPFALDSQLAARGWSPMIREVVMTRRMPPGQVDHKVGHAVADAMNLRDEDMQKLIHWIDAGSPVVGDRDPLAELVWPDSRWQLGQPDLVVQIPPQSIPATGVIDYMDIVVDLGLTEDRWLRASEVTPGDASVLHHIITTVIPPDSPADARDPERILMDTIAGMPPEQARLVTQRLEAALQAGREPDLNVLFAGVDADIDLSSFLSGANDPDIASVSGYAPGTLPLVMPEGMGGVLRAGTRLNLQMHYTTTGRETVDASQIGLYFYPEDVIPERRMASAVANGFGIAIPPHARDHEMRAGVIVPQDAYIYSLMPHMHFRGKRMRFVAQYPDGSEELLLSVPNYHFNWQISHRLEEPLRVPGGTRILAIGAFDNSAQNRFNPDPDIEVQWGEQSWEEMFMGFYNWAYANQ